MLRIRMQRHGGTNRPFFRIVAIDARKHYSRNMEVIGFVAPLSHTLQVDIVRLNQLLENGAKITRNLFMRMKKVYPDLSIKHVG